MSIKKANRNTINIGQIISIVKHLRTNRRKHQLNLPLSKYANLKSSYTYCLLSIYRHQSTTYKFNLGDSTFKDFWYLNVPEVERLINLAKLNFIKIDEHSFSQKRHAKRLIIKVSITKLGKKIVRDLINPLQKTAKLLKVVIFSLSTLLVLIAGSALVGVNMNVNIPLIPIYITLGILGFFDLLSMSIENDDSVNLPKRLHLKKFLKLFKGIKNYKIDKNLLRKLFE